MGRPEPLAARAAVTFLAAAAVRSVVQRGWLGPGVDTAGEQVLADALVSAGGALVMWWWSRGKVTPTDDPRTATNVPLVPVTRARQLGDSPDLEDLGRDDPGRIAVRVGRSGRAGRVSGLAVARAGSLPWFTS